MRRTSPTRLARALCLLAGLCALLALGAGSAAANQLYWADGGPAPTDLGVGPLTLDQSTIGVLDAVGDGTGGRNIVAAAGAANGTVVDAAAGRIYWLSAGSSSIRYANLDGSGQGTLAIGTATILPGQSLGLALNPATGTLYWSNVFSIQYAKTNGSGGGTLYDSTGRPDLFAGGASTPAIDPDGNRIYWGGLAFSGSGIAYANLDGSGGGGFITPSCASPNSPTTLVLVHPAANTLYGVGFRVSDGDTAVQRMRLDGSQCETLTDQAAIPGLSGFTGGTLDPTTNRLILTSGSGLLWINLADPTKHGTYAAGSATLSQPALPSFLVAPAATAAPVATPATSLVGATLTCSAPTWSSGIPGANVAQLPSTANAYAWTRNGTAVSGATAATLKATAAGSYACTVTAGNAAGAGTTTSAAVTVTDPTASAAKPRLRLRGTTVTVSVTTTGPGVVQINGTLAGPGRAAARVCTARATFAKAGTKRMRCVPTAATQRLRKKGPVRIALAMTFTPTGGTAKTSAIGTVTLAQIKTRPAPPVTG